MKKLLLLLLFFSAPLLAESPEGDIRLGGLDSTIIAWKIAGKRVMLREAP